MGDNKNQPSEGNVTVQLPWCLLICNSWFGIRTSSHERRFPRRSACFTFRNIRVLYQPLCVCRVLRSSDSPNFTSHSPFRNDVTFLFFLLLLFFFFCASIDIVSLVYSCRTRFLSLAFSSSIPFFSSLPSPRLLLFRPDFLPFIRTFFFSLIFLSFPPTFLLAGLLQIRSCSNNWTLAACIVLFLLFYFFSNPSRVCTAKCLTLPLVFVLSYLSF